MKNPSSKKKRAASQNDLLKRLNSFEEITQKIFIKKPLEKLLNEIILTGKTLLNAEAGSLFLYDNKTLFLVAGVTGKSIPAALIVSTVYSFLRAYLTLNMQNFELVQFVELLNRFLIQSTGSDKFVTAWFGLYDHSSKTMKSINAGQYRIAI